MAGKCCNRLVRLNLQSGCINFGVGCKCGIPVFGRRLIGNAVILHNSKRCEMGKIGYGYGSEWHLLRFLGYHRQYLLNKLASEINAFQGYKINIKDTKFSSSNNIFELENEFKGIDVYSSKKILENWQKYWPQTGNVQNWDAIVELTGKDTDEIVFVEAKAHLDEIKSSCGASSNSKNQIEKAFIETINYFGLGKTNSTDWFSPYYQFANRLAFLHFLLKNGIKAHLLFVYFCGEDAKNYSGKVVCPEDKTCWEKAISNMYNRVGVNKKMIKNTFFNRVHKIFIPINPNAI